MILQPHETERFYRIWWALLSYVNAQRHLIRNLPAQPAPGSVNPADAVKIRDALWADDALREKFIAQNPASLPPADLETVASWKYRLAGSFFVFRYLKKHTIFLHEGPPPRAYGVLGLVSPIEEIIGPYLPVLVEAVLLPFEDKIIYDSLLTPYRITFGGGIRTNLKVSYRDAVEREGIITSLIPRTKPLTADEAQANARTRNTRLINEFRKALYKSGLSPKTVEHHVSNVEAFANTYLLAQAPPRPLLEASAEDVEAYLRSRSSKEAQAAAKSFKRYARFLRDTGRGNPDAFLDSLRSLQVIKPVK